MIYSLDKRQCANFYVKSKIKKFWGRKFHIERLTFYHTQKFDFKFTANSDNATPYPLERC